VGLKSEVGVCRQTVKGEGSQIRGGGAEIPRDPPPFNHCSDLCNHNASASHNGGRTTTCHFFHFFFILLCNEQSRQTREINNGEVEQKYCNTVFESFVALMFHSIFNLSIKQVYCTEPEDYDTYALNKFKTVP